MSRPVVAVAIFPLRMCLKCLFSLTPFLSDDADTHTRIFDYTALGSAVMRRALSHLDTGPKTGGFSPAFSVCFLLMCMIRLLSLTPFLRCHTQVHVKLTAND